MVFKNEKQVFGKSIFRMHWVVGTWLITSLLGLGMGHNTLFEGYVTLSGYHLCDVTELVSVSNVISFPTSFTQRRPCGGWLPWTMCDVTVYKTEYQTKVYNMSKQVRKCCHGYEQVGSYCAVSLNRSADFTSKPGLCPSASVSPRNHSTSSGSSMCKWDIDCPQWQKCCQTENISNIYQCSNPVPVNRTCFNVTITVKTSFQLVTMDEGLFNHTRLLYSMVTGALGTAEISVHYVQSWSAGPFTTSSSLLVCSSNVLFLDGISTSLNLLGNIEEVTNVVVQDVDACSVPGLNSCSAYANCTNTAGSYSCVCHHGYQDLNHSQPGTVCRAPTVTTHPLTDNTTPPSITLRPTAPTVTTHPLTDNTTPPSITLRPTDYIPEITSLFSYDVNASAFHVAWTTDNQTGVTFHLVLLQGTIELKNMSNVENFSWTFTDLNPAVLYTVRVTPFACGNRGNSSEIKVRTDGQMLKVTARFTNMNYTEALSDSSSEEYKKFCQDVINEILLSSPPDIHALIISKQITIQITSLSAGSVFVHFSFTFQNGSNLNMTSLATDLASLRNSTKYTVDNSSILIEVVNECLAGEADCSPWASCNKTVGSYTCACWSGYTDLSPSRPGRSCAASPNATTTINPTTNHPGVSSTASSTTTSSITTTTFGNPSTTHHVPGNTSTTVSSTATTNRITTNIPTTILAHTTHNPGGITASSQQPSNITGPLVSYVTVECGMWYTSVFIRKDALLAYGIPSHALYLGQPQCAANIRNESHVWLTAAWNKCNTTLENNGTHTLVNVTLYNNYSAASSEHLEIPITCTYPSNILISMDTGYDAPSGYNMINSPVAGLGSFQVTVRLLNGTSPLPEKYAFSQNEEVIVEVGVNTTIPQIKIIINTCWVTSDRDSTVLLIPVFLKDGCSTNIYATVLQNGNDTVSLLSVRIFSLVNQDVVFMHCQIQICVENQEKTCKPDCLGRAYRSANLVAATKASIGPLNRLQKASYQSEASTLQTVGFVLLGVGVFLLSLAAIAGLVYHKRKIGNYNFNFNPQQENFSYHVFST